MVLSQTRSVYHRNTDLNPNQSGGTKGGTTGQSYSIYFTSCQCFCAPTGSHHSHNRHGHGLLHSPLGILVDIKETSLNVSGINPLRRNTKVFYCQFGSACLVLTLSTACMANQTAARSAPNAAQRGNSHSSYKTSPLPMQGARKKLTSPPVRGVLKYTRPGLAERLLALQTLRTPS